MDKRSHIKYKKVEFDKIIDINLDSGIFIENKDDNHYNNLGKLWNGINGWWLIFNGL